MLILSIATTAVTPLHQLRHHISYATKTVTPLHQLHHYSGYATTAVMSLHQLRQYIRYVTTEVTLLQQLHQLLHYSSYATTAVTSLQQLRHYTAVTLLQQTKKIGFYPKSLRPIFRISYVVEDSIYTCSRNFSCAPRGCLRRSRLIKSSFFLLNKLTNIA